MNKNIKALAVLGISAFLALPSWALEQVVYTSDLTNYVTKAEVELRYEKFTEWVVSEEGVTVLWSDYNGWGVMSDAWDDPDYSMNTDRDAVEFECIASGITATRQRVPVPGYVLGNQTNAIIAAVQDIVLQPVYAEVSGSGEFTFQYSDVPDGWTVQGVTIAPSGSSEEIWTLTVLTPSGERQFTSNIYAGATELGFFISGDPLIVITARKIETPTVGPLIGYTLPNQTNCVLLAQSYVDDNYISKVALHNALTNINTNLQTANDTRSAVSNLITILKGL